MQREDWDKRYAAVENLWAVKPNRFLVAEVAELDARARARPRLRRGPERDLARERSAGTSPGVDYSEVAISKGARAGRARRRRRSSSCAPTSLDYEPEAAAFDLVLVLYLHIPAHERRGVLERAAAALAPGGTFVSSATT